MSESTDDGTDLPPTLLREIAEAKDAALKSRDQALRILEACSTCSAVLGQAIMDAEEFDHLLARAGKQIKALRNCCSLHDEKALRSVRAIRTRWQRIFESKRNNMGSGVDSVTSNSSLALHIIREKYKDRGNFEAAINECALWIQQMAEEGNVRFFTALAKLIVKPPKFRGLEEWIWRAWLPLKLWGYPENGRQAFDEMERAGSILSRPELEKWTRAKFDRAWRNVNNDIEKELF